MMTLKDRIAKVIKHRLDGLDIVSSQFMVDAAIAEAAAAVLNEVKAFIRDAE